MFADSTNVNSRYCFECYNSPRTLPNQDGFRFRAVDSQNKLHDCIVEKGADGLHRLKSQTIKYKDIIGWVRLK